MEAACESYGTHDKSKGARKARRSPPPPPLCEPETSALLDAASGSKTNPDKPNGKRRAKKKNAGAPVGEPISEPEKSAQIDAASESNTNPDKSNGKRRAKRSGEPGPRLSRAVAKSNRACINCRLVKTHKEFLADGCDNCEEKLRLAGQKPYVTSYTSLNFKGMVAMIDPKDSWVARWKGIANLKPGLYAVSVLGDMPAWITRRLEK